VSCYTLLSAYQLPWPPSRCLYLSTLFGGSLSKVKAVLTVCSVDPALPDLLTRRGPLGHAYTYLRSGQGPEQSTSVIGSVIGVEEQKSSHVLQSVSLPHDTTDKERTVASYPVGYFGRNQLLGSSMGLSPLYDISTSNLHVSIATIFHR